MTNTKHYKKKEHLQQSIMAYNKQMSTIRVKENFEIPTQILFRLSVLSAAPIMESLVKDAPETTHTQYSKYTHNMFCEAAAASGATQQQGKTLVLAGEGITRTQVYFCCGDGR